MAGVSTLLVAAVGTALVAATYAWVGLRLLGRPLADPSARRALRGFSLWWIAIATNQFLWAILNGAGAIGFASFDTQVTYAITQRILLGAALFGLMTYLLFVRTGRDHRWALGTYYALYVVGVLYTFHWGMPQGLHEGSWRIDIDFARQSPRVVSIVFLVALMAPPVAACIAYAGVRHSVLDPSQRWRITVTSWGLVVWWILTVVAALPVTAEIGWLQALNRVVSLGVAVAILMAYLPPTWVTRRFGIEAYGPTR